MHPGDNIVALCFVLVQQILYP